MAKKKSAPAKPKSIKPRNAPTKSELELLDLVEQIGGKKYRVLIGLKMLISKPNSVKVDEAYDMEYIRSVPKHVPANKILVHSHLKPHRRPGTDGRRAWLSSRLWLIVQPKKHVLCDCDWAPEVGEHYRPYRKMDYESSNQALPLHAPGTCTSST